GSDFLRGAASSQYITDSNGITQIYYTGTPGAGLTTFNTLRQTGTQTNILQRAYAGTLDHAINTYNAIAGALDPVQHPLPPGWPTFPDTYGGSMMSTVARLISTYSTLNMRRQIFFVNLGSYDTHNDQLKHQGDLLTELSQSLKALYDATVL